MKRHLLGTIVILLCASASYAQGVLYGASKSGQLFTINLSTGVGTLVGKIPIGTKGQPPGTTEIVFDNATGRAFDQFNAENFAGQEFDINTGAAIGPPISNGGSYDGLEWIGSTLYGTATLNEKGDSELRTLDPYSGTSTLIGPTGMAGINGLAYDQTTGIMYGSSGGSKGPSSLVIINLSTGAAREVGSIGVNVGSLEFGPDGNLYAGSVGGQTGGSGNLYRINKSTGAGTLVGATGFLNITGLARVGPAAPPPTPTPTPTSTPTPSTIQFSVASTSVGEDSSQVTLNVNRSGDASGAATVNYTTSDVAGAQNCSIVNGNASSRCDYIASIGTLSFAPGESSKSIFVLIINDSYPEGPETFSVTLSSPTGASLGVFSTATVTINDNDATAGANPIDRANFFVTEHYYDFLNRLPDNGGLAFWTNEITSCGADAGCIEVKRINVSAAYFLSIEFQQTGYLVERMYKSAYGTAAGNSTSPSAHTLQVPIVRFNEFLPDTQRIGQGVVVGAPGWETALENNKVAFAAEFVQRTRFTSQYPTTLSPSTFVDQLFVNAGVTPTTTERNAATAEFGSATNTSDLAARGRTLRRVAENATLVTNEFNRAFVLMQFFGYLRRDPNDLPDTDYTGYDFWLTKLNQFGGNFINAEMVKAFINSLEYRQRFAP